MKYQESHLKGTSLFELTEMRLRTLSNIASMCIECGPEDNDLFNADQVHYDKKVITDAIVDELISATENGPFARLDLLKKYVAIYRNENSSLKRTQFVTEKIGESEESIRNLHIMFTNSVIGFTDPLEQA